MTSRKTPFLLALVALALLFGGGTWLYRSQQAQQAAENAARNRQSLERPHAPTLGEAQAPVHIVEFLDPACETCAAFYPLVKGLMAKHPQQIKLTVRYAPFHRGSADVVRLLEATRKQGKYWETLELLFQRQGAWVRNHTADVERVFPLLRGTGLDVERLRADMAAPEIERILGQDMLDLRILKVSKTPEYFVNGRPLPEFGYEPLRDLVQQELAAAARR